MKLALIAAALLLGPALIPALIPAPALPVRVYNVSDGAAFPALSSPTPHVLIFRNGLFQSPGIDYTMVAQGAGVSWRFFPGFLQSGDQVEVVTLP